MDTPFVQFSDLTSVTTGIQDIDLVAVSENVTTVRVPAATLLGGFVTKAGSADTGATGDLYFGDDGLYFKADTTWKKVPSYPQALWEDLTESTRFLYVNSTMPLSDEERSNVLDSLNIRTATQESVGLVKGSTSVSVGSDGALSVSVATVDTPGLTKVADAFSEVGTWDSVTAATPNFVKTCVAFAIDTNNKAIASNDTLGIVMGGTDIDSVYVDSATGKMTIPVATKPGSERPGITYLAASTIEEFDEQTGDRETYAAPVALVKEIVNHYVASGMSPAVRAEDGKAGHLGAVTPEAGPDGNILCSNDANAFIRVRKATDLVDGTVHVTPANLSGSQSEMLAAHGTKAATLSGVNKFITAGDYVKKSTLSEALEDTIASTTSLGAIKASATVNVSAITGVATVPNGTMANAGVVKVHEHRSVGTPAEVVSYTEYISSYGPASSTKAGRVKVAGVSEGSSYPTVVSYEEFAGRLYLYAGSATAGFIRAVSVEGEPELGVCPTAITTKYWQSAKAAETYPGLSKVYGADGTTMPSSVSLENVFSEMLPVRDVYQLTVNANSTGAFYFDTTGKQYRHNTLCYVLKDSALLHVNHGSATGVSDPAVDMIATSTFDKLVGESCAVVIRLVLVGGGTSAATVRFNGAWTPDSTTPIGSPITVAAGSIKVYELAAYKINNSTYYTVRKLI